ncbi:hypothetical protein EW145_g2288 [Phellinidium pouzarii]|uniref:C2 domain-containing protein n=1 Tax=Phellinidium pouzarii TaxID=167371 RepID=A0A4S4LBH9_9AGAM|nr:hypothetical protein EW145_g2288 [Phellinidium pouzarii]
MSTTPREIGTLVVVILKAQHLPNKRHIGKQDPYCCVTLNGDKRRTRAIKRGGQHPEWDEERTGGETPPPPPPKETKRKKKVKGGNAMVVACFADDPKEPDLIGETVVDLTEVLTKGETDEWFTLQNKDKFSGEVYLELTFWSNERPPEKKSKIRPMKSGDQYGGPGTFVPSESESSFGNDDNKSVPSSLRSASSLAQLNLYNPPYESQSPRTVRSQGTGSTLNQLADEFGELTVGPGPEAQRRRVSFPPPRNGHTPRPSDSGYSTLHSSLSYHSSGYSSGDYSDSGSSCPATPVPRDLHQRHSFGEPTQTYTPYRSPYESGPVQSSDYSPSHGHPQQDYAPSMYNIPSASSGFIPVPTPTPSGFASAPTGAPGPSGFMPPMSHTPVPSAYVQHPSQTPVPFGYGPPLASSGFAPPRSAMGYQQPYSTQIYPPYQPYPPPPASTPPMMYPPGPPSAVAPSQQYPSNPSPSHSALQQYSSTPLSQSTMQQYSSNPSPPHSTPQQYSSVPSPSRSVPPQQYSSAPHPSHTNPVQQYPTYVPGTPSPPQPYNPSPPVHGSRPLPTPGVQNGSFPATPPNAVTPTPPHAASPTHAGPMGYSNTPPHVQVQPQSHPLPTPPGPPPQMPMTNGPPPSAVSEWLHSTTTCTPTQETFRPATAASRSLPTTIPATRIARSSDWIRAAASTAAPSSTTCRCG